MKDNTYTWDEVPPELHGVDETLDSVKPKVIETLQKVIAAEEASGVSAVATHVFDRKGFYSFSDLIDEPRGMRRFENEDVILQVTVRVPARHVQELIDFAAEEGNRAREAARRAEFEAIEAQIAELRERQAHL